MIATPDEDEPDIGSLAVFWDANGNVYSARRTFLGWTWNPPAANADPRATLTWDEIYTPELELAAVIPMIEDKPETITASSSKLLRTRKRATSAVPPKAKSIKRKKHPAKPAIPPRLSPDRPVFFESPDELGTNIAVLAGGRTLTGAHGIERCIGDTCAIHNVTQHPLSEWPQEYDELERTISRICPHGIMHPDPDDAPYRASTGRSTRHTCDGCCDEQYMLDAMKGWA
jgi:hypothetical protein